MARAIKDCPAQDGDAIEIRHILEMSIFFRMRPSGA
jgi:hypothetical protein